MKSSHLVISIFRILALLLIVRTFVSSQEQSLVLEVKQSRSTYLKSESIYIEIYLHNFSNNDIAVNWLSLDLGFLNLIVKDRNGSLYKCKKPSTQAEQFQLRLPSKDTESLVINLIPSYGVGDWRPFPTKKYLSTGSYSVQAEFNSGYGIIKSDIISFNITEPEGADHEGFLLLDKAADLTINNRLQEAITILESLKLRFPKCVYTPSAFKEQIRIYYNPKMLDEEKAYRTAKSLIDNYPDTEYAIFGLSSILTHIASVGNNEKIRREILEHVCKTYPQSKVGEYGKKIYDKEKNYYK